MIDVIGCLWPGWDYWYVTLAYEMVCDWCDWMFVTWMGLLVCYFGICCECVWACMSKASAYGCVYVDMMRNMWQRWWDNDCVPDICWEMDIDVDVNMGCGCGCGLTIKGNTLWFTVFYSFCSTPLTCRRSPWALDKYIVWWGSESDLVCNTPYRVLLFWVGMLLLRRFETILVIYF